MGEFIGHFQKSAFFNQDNQKKELIPLRNNGAFVCPSEFHGGKKSADPIARTPIWLNPCEKSNFKIYIHQK